MKTTGAVCCLSSFSATKMTPNDLEGAFEVCKVVSFGEGKPPDRAIYEPAGARAPATVTYLVFLRLLFRLIKEITLE